MAFIMVSLSVYSRKEIVLKSGTLIPVQSVNTVRATDVKIGQLIPFRVARVMHNSSKSNEKKM